MHDELGAAALRSWARLAVTALELHRGELDALNVFPVADSDTGTNLYLTLREAAQAIDRLDADAGPGEVGKAFARGALVGARGNSGVIVSQYLGALLRAVAEVRHTLPAALHQATAAAYRAVGDPIEGTVLTVARAVGESAHEVAADRAHEVGADGTLAVLEGAIEAGYVALSRTTAQLAPLREAGVLDAGGWGLMLVLDALADALRGTQRVRQVPVPEAAAPAGADGAPVPEGEAPACNGHEYGSGEFEVMYLVEAAPELNGDDSVANALRAGLAKVGESVAVVGGDGLWQAHVHTGDPLAAVAAAGGAGVEAFGIRVRHIASQTGVHGEHRPRVGLVTVTAAPGLAADLARAGAVVVMVGPGHSAGPELARAADDTGAAVVVLLAREGLLAEVPERGGLRVTGGLSEAQLVAGTATLASLDPGLDPDELAAQIETAVARVRTVSVSGSRDAAAVVAAAQSLLEAPCALLTVVTSTGTPAETVTRLRAAVGSRVELVLLAGGAPGEQVVLGAE